MMLRTALTLAVAALTLGTSVASATPDGYQPQLKSVSQPDAIERYVRNNPPVLQPDAVERYLRNNSPVLQPDAIERYLRNNTPQSGAVKHPDSRGARFSLAVASTQAPGGDGRDWTAGVVGAVSGALFAVLAIAGVSAVRGRRRLAGAS